MNRSAGGLALLLVGSLGLIGFLTGNLDRWLAFLFSPDAAATATGQTTTVTGTGTTAGGGRVTRT